MMKVVYTSEQRRVVSSFSVDSHGRRVVLAEDADGAGGGYYPGEVELLTRKRWKLPSSTYHPGGVELFLASGGHYPLFRQRIFFQNIKKIL
ncbi:hypothetical protein [Schaalia sp. lx-260]|uniref:hypothetical protein n=1 Tax=Schaalia sp. lx-260 TaxID=2899082 RepID=UPI001E470D01|nr:hypothetical protein [Schaalia sp. lx-260]MCD4549997.1 hypothetical protein [Schaalia sp. lx-260]